MSSQLFQVPRIAIRHRATISVIFDLALILLLPPVTSLGQRGGLKGLPRGSWISTIQVPGPFKHQVVMGRASGSNIDTVSRITLLLMELKAFEMS